MATDLVPFTLQVAVLLLFALTIMHVQVATRFVSACPIVYWQMAGLWLRSPHRPAPAGLVGFVVSFLSDARHWLVAYCVGYMAVGCMLFGNFYNWT